MKSLDPAQAEEIVRLLLADAPADVKDRYEASTKANRDLTPQDKVQELLLAYSIEYVSPCQMIAFGLTQLQAEFDDSGKTNSIEIGQFKFSSEDLQNLKDVALSFSSILEVLELPSGVREPYKDWMDYGRTNTSRSR